MRALVYSDNSGQGAACDAEVLGTWGVATVESKLTSEFLFSPI